MSTVCMENTFEVDGLNGTEEKKDELMEVDPHEEDVKNVTVLTSNEGTSESDNHQEDIKDVRNLEVDIKDESDLEVKNIEEEYSVDAPTVDSEASKSDYIENGHSKESELEAESKKLESFKLISPLKTEEPDLPPDEAEVFSPFTKLISGKYHLKKIEPEIRFPKEFTKTGFFKNTKYTVSHPPDDLKDCMYRTCSTAAEYPYLFHHHQVATMEVARAVFYPGMIVTVDSKKYKVLTINTPYLLVVHGNEDPIQFECWRADFCQALDTSEDEDDIFLWPRFITAQNVKKIIEWLRKPQNCKKQLYTFIKEGQYLEVINERNPEYVDVAKVSRNCCGLLYITRTDGKEEIVHMSSPRLKPLGWINSGVKGFRKSINYSISREYKGVLPFVFDLDPFEFLPEQAGFSQPLSFNAHKFEKNNLVVVLDPVTRFQYYLGIVTHVYNQYFFRVSIMEDVNKDIKEWKTINCHHASSVIAHFSGGPKDFSITMPEGITSRDQLTCDELSKKLGRELTTASLKRFVTLSVDGERLYPFDDGEEDGLDSLPPRRCLPRTLVEVFDYSTGFPHIGRILRVMKQFMVISLETYPDFNPPKLYSFSDTSIYPIGFSKEAGLKIHTPFFVLSPSFPSVKLSEEYSCKIGDNKPYMSVKYMNEKQWTPKIFINKNCFKGPFVMKDRIWRLQNSYGPGPLEIVLKILLTDLTSCSESQKIAHLCHMKKLNDFHMIVFKYYDNDGNERKHSTNRCHFSIVSCRSIAELPHWLHVLCRLLDSCPGFININERMAENECEYGCGKISNEFKYMLPEYHIHSAHAVYMAGLEKPKNKRSRKTAVEQLEEMNKDKPTISPRKRPHRSDDDDDDGAYGRYYTRRCRVSIAGASPVTKPKIDDDDDSDSTETLSSDDDEPIPQLFPAIEDLRYGQRSSVSDRMPVLQEQAKRNDVAALLARLPKPQFPPRSNARVVSNGGPRVRLARPLERPNSNPILDPRVPSGGQILDPRITPPSVQIRPLASHVVRSPSGYQLGYDRNSGSYVFNEFSGTPKYTVPITSGTKQRQPEVITIEDSPEKRSSEDIPPISSNPWKWNTAQVSAYLKKARFEDSQLKFIQENRMDGEEFLRLSSEEFKELGLKLGPAMKLHDLATKIKQKVSGHFSND